jgi:tripeptidyl-peptidase I
MTDFHIYEHADTGSKNVACESYALPKSVRDHVDYVTPGIRLRKDINKVREKRSLAKIRDTHIAKRGFRPTNTGLAPIDGELFDAAASPQLIPLNTSVCDRYITNDCIRSEFPWRLR